MFLEDLIEAKWQLTRSISHTVPIWVTPRYPLTIYWVSASWEWNWKNSSNWLKTIWHWRTSNTPYNQTIYTELMPWRYHWYFDSTPRGWNSGNEWLGQNSASDPLWCSKLSMWILLLSKQLAQWRTTRIAYQWRSSKSAT
jgi:hypothetical protein